MIRRLAVAAAALLLPLTAGGCGSEPGAADSTTDPLPASRTLTVFAAASLKNPFTTLGRQFEANHPGTTVTFNFAGSADLVSQLQQGAPADVFAAADAENMDKATADDLTAGTPVSFASNTLQIAVPPGNPAQVASFRDLTRPGLRLVVCAPAVPCGSATVRIETVTGLELAPVSEESSVTDVLNKVQTGEADAGLVYRSDVEGAGEKVLGIAFPESAQAVNRYPIVLLAGSANPDLARQFTELVTGTVGQQVLADAGFGEA